MLKLLLVPLVALSLVGTPAAAPDCAAPEAVAHEWSWVQVSPRADGWTTRGGQADVVIDGERFEATLLDDQGESLHVLRGRADGDQFTKVEFFSPKTGLSQRGLAPLYDGRRREAFPQTMGDAPEPPQRLWESITLTSLDSFVGLTRK